MKFVFYMNMTSSNGNPVHPVIGEHESKDMEELLDHLDQFDFILVTEYFRDKTPNGVYSVGPIILNSRHIGKIKQWGE